LVLHEDRKLDLLSLKEIENKLNDGCACHFNLSIIDENGEKISGLDMYEPNTGWAVASLKKKKVAQLIESGHGFVMHNMTQINQKISALIDSVEEEFEDHFADLHVYISPTKNATSFKIHKDYPQHKIYIQLFGISNWTIFSGTVEEGLKQAMQTDLHPGHVLYLPPGMYHKVTNREGPRISLSIPFMRHDELNKMDRTHISLPFTF